MAFSKDDWIKRQFNKPRDVNGNRASVMEPKNGYAYEDLQMHAIYHGWGNNIFSDPDSPNDFPYWDNYLMPEGGAEVFVSVYGEVACCYNKHSDEIPSFRVLAQQWNLQHIPEDYILSPTELREAKGNGVERDTAILNKVKSRQKYLYVNINTNACYKQTHSSVALHSMVGLVHSPILLEDTEWDARSQMYRLKGSFALDHLDKDKTNNSVFNLNWTTGTRNQLMTGVSWSIEQKRQFFKDAAKLDKVARDKLLLN